MFEHNITPIHICETIERTYYDLYVVFNSFDNNKLDIVIRDERFKEYDHLENNNILIEDFINDMIIPSLYKVHLAGIQGITKAFPYKRNNGGDKLKDEWICFAKGNNLRDIYKLDDVDTIRTTSDNLWEIYETFGITATRKYLREEFDRIISNDGTYVSPCHIETLVGFMTYSGTLYSASRYGIDRDECGPLAKASFEENLENFIKASLYTEKDNMKSTASNIMMCQQGNFGTGYFDTFYKSKEIVKEELEYEDI